jgi:hypothetical protein
MIWSTRGRFCQYRGEIRGELLSQFACSIDFIACIDSRDFSEVQLLWGVATIVSGYGMGDREVCVMASYGRAGTLVPARDSVHKYTAT